MTGSDPRDGRATPVRSFQEAIASLEALFQIRDYLEDAAARASRLERASYQFVSTRRFSSSNQFWTTTSAEADSTCVRSEPRVFRSIYLTHSARTNEREHFVSAETGAGREGHGFQGGTGKVYAETGRVPPRMLRPLRLEAAMGFTTVLHATRARYCGLPIRAADLWSVAYDVERCGQFVGEQVWGPEQAEPSAVPRDDGLRVDNETGSVDGPCGARTIMRDWQSMTRARLTSQPGTRHGVGGLFRAVVPCQKVNDAPTCTIRGRMMEVVALAPAVNGSK